MANTPLHFSATVLDGLDTAAAITSYLLVPDSTTLAQLTSQLDTWAAAVDACIDGAITDVSARLTPSLPGGLKAATGATWLASRVEQTAILNLADVASTHRNGQALPSLRNTAIVGGQVNIADTAIQALVALMTNPANHFTNAESVALGGAIDALLTFRQRRQLPRTSFEV